MRSCRPFCSGWPGSIPLGDDAELDPPDRQGREPRRRLRCEGRPVVRANARRQSELAKDSLELRAHGLLTRLGEGLASEQVATEAIRDGERVAARSIAQTEVALEVDTPDRVGSIAFPCSSRAEPATLVVSSDCSGRRRHRRAPTTASPAEAWCRVFGGAWTRPNGLAGMFAARLREPNTPWRPPMAHAPHATSTTPGNGRPPPARARVRRTAALSIWITGDRTAERTSDRRCLHRLHRRHWILLSRAVVACLRDLRVRVRGKPSSLANQWLALGRG